MTRRPPTIMVSSTFYDLRQIRTDLGRFIREELGYTPLLSELPTFPVEPDVDAIENCTRRVTNDADILILVVGGRYGSTEEKTAKSITNLEYLAAREMRLPIFAFIDRSILPLVALHRKNPTADFSQFVDDPRVLSFIDEIRSTHKIWTHEFTSAQDIIDTMRVQLSHMMRDGLLTLKQFSDIPVQSRISRLHGVALKTALTKPLAWEYLLFAYALRDRISTHSDLRKDYEMELLLGVFENVRNEDFIKWSETRLDEVLNQVYCIEKLINSELKVAFGPPGQAGDVDLIIFVAERLGIVYQKALEWAQQVKCTSVEDPFKPVIQVLATYSATIITCIETYPQRILDAVLPNVNQPGSRTVEIKLSFDPPDVENFRRVMRLAAKDAFGLEIE
ncbi:MAG: DUF4062 domain-containing protein [Planctomycetota bacterium]|nr:DUF4062 domain-containing protein [Planctomycetota bacterium]